MINFFLRKIKPDAAQRTKVGELAGVFGLVSNIILFIGKFLIGFTAGSVSIMADAMNSLSDTIASILTLVGFRIAAKPADSEHPYGHERFEYISGLAISLIITLVGFQFLQSSFQKILHPENVRLSIYLFAVLIASIAIKIWQGRMYLTLAKKIDSQTLTAASKDSLNDVYTTLAVLLSALFEWVTHLRIDGYVGFLLALYILYSGIMMVKDFVGELLGSRPTDQEIQAMENKLDTYEAILGYHDLLVHDYGPQKRFASVHIEVDASLSLIKAHKIIDRIEKDFHETLDVDLVCHLDPVEISDVEYVVIKRQVQTIIFQLDERLRIHDFRIKKNRKILQFDLVVPEHFPLKDQEMKQKLEQVVQAEIGAYHLDVTFDHNYLL